MFTLALAALLALLPVGVPPTHHLVLHAGHRFSLIIRNDHMKGWSLQNNGPIAVTFQGPPHHAKHKTTLDFTADARGIAMFWAQCDGGKVESWALDVR